MRTPWVSRALHEALMQEKDKQIAQLTTANEKLLLAVQAAKEVHQEEKADSDTQPMRPRRLLGADIRTMVNKEFLERYKAGKG